MNKFKLAVKKIYICLTIVGLGPQAFAADFTFVPQTKSPIALKKGLPADVRQLPKLPKTPELILENKDIFLKRERPTMGPRTGGGGNSCSLAISQNTRKLVELFQIETYSKIVEFSKVLPVIKSARFFTQDQLSKDGQTKDAMNYPAEGKVIVTPKFCATELVEVSGRSMSLLLHEYLGLARIDDTKYQISGKFLELYAADIARNAQARVYLEAELKKELQGQNSCFAGAVKTKISELSEIDPGWSSKDDLGMIETQVVRSAEHRNGLNNCDTFLDKSGRKTDDKENAVYKVCNTFDTYEYAATVPFSYFGRRVSTQDGLIFKVEELRTVTLVVDKDADYADLQTATKSYINSSFKCSPVQF